MVVLGKEENLSKFEDYNIRKFPAEMFIQAQYFGDVIINNDFFMFVSFGL